MSEILDGPPPPGNVRLITPDGDVPVDCSFDGWDGDGVAIWTILAKPGIVVIGVKADYIPGRTGLRMQVGEA